MADLKSQLEAVVGPFARAGHLPSVDACITTRDVTDVHKEELWVLYAECLHANYNWAFFKNHHRTCLHNRIAAAQVCVAEAEQTMDDQADRMAFLQYPSLLLICYMMLASVWTVTQ